MSVKVHARNPAMDVVRLFALLCVICVHFFLNSGYYDIYCTGSTMFVFTIFRSFFMICVPLFMLLSGYLMKNKQPNAAYFSKIFQTLFIYFLSSVFCLAYRFYISQENITATAFLSTLFRGFFSYSAAPYSWYIEMYIGLFFLIPFLNILYNNINTKKSKQLFLLILLLLSSADSIDFNWFIYGNASEQNLHVIPRWWSSAYPMMYYFFGAYLQEYPLNMRKWINIAAINIVCISQTIYVFLHNTNNSFVEGPWQHYNSFLTILLSILVFNFLAQANYNWIGNKGRKLLAYLSSLSLGAYLVSWIFDMFFYKILNSNVSYVPYRFLFFVPTVAAVLLCSLGLSALMNFIYSVVHKFTVFLRRNSQVKT